LRQGPGQKKRKRHTKIEWTEAEAEEEDKISCKNGGLLVMAASLQVFDIVCFDKVTAPMITYSACIPYFT
jgi:hypothetical protein